MAETTRKTAAAIAAASPEDEKDVAAPAEKQNKSATLAGDDGTPRKIHVAGMQHEFGPITVEGTEYTITREGTNVAGAHVKAVRDSASAHGVPLRSSKADEDPAAGA